MANKSVDGESATEVTLKVDEEGRVTLPKEIRDQLDIGSHNEISARMIGSVLEVNHESKSELQAATSNDELENATPSEAGYSLFGPPSSRK